jgi:hypothetical protein
VTNGTKIRCAGHSDVQLLFGERQVQNSPRDVLQKLGQLVQPMLPLLLDRFPLVPIGTRLPTIAGRLLVCAAREESRDSCGALEELGLGLQGGATQGRFRGILRSSGIRTRTRTWDQNVCVRVCCIHM